MKAQFELNPLQILMDKLNNIIIDEDYLFRLAIETIKQGNFVANIPKMQRNLLNIDFNICIDQFDKANNLHLKAFWFKYVTELLTVFAKNDQATLEDYKLYSELNEELSNVICEAIIEQEEIDWTPINKVINPVCILIEVTLRNENLKNSECLLNSMMCFLNRVRPIIGNDISQNFDFKNQAVFSPYFKGKKSAFSFYSLYCILGFIVREKINNLILSSAEGEAIIPILCLYCINNNLNINDAFDNEYFKKIEVQDYYSKINSDPNRDEIIEKMNSYLQKSRENACMELTKEIYIQLLNSPDFIPEEFISHKEELISLLSISSNKAIEFALKNMSLLNNLPIYPPIFSELLFDHNFNYLETPIPFTYRLIFSKEELEKYSEFNKKFAQKSSNMNERIRVNFFDFTIKNAPKIINLFTILNQDMFRFLNGFINNSTLGLVRFFDSYHIYTLKEIQIMRTLLSARNINFKNRETLFSLTSLLFVALNPYPESYNEFLHSLSKITKKSDFSEVKKICDDTLKNFLSIEFNITQEEVSKIVGVNYTLMWIKLLEGKKNLPSRSQIIFDEFMQVELKQQMSFFEFSTNPNQKSSLGSALGHHNQAIFKSLKDKKIDVDKFLNYPNERNITIGKSEFTIKQWDKNQIKTLLLGNELSCCLATTGLYFYAILERRMDHAMFMHVVTNKTGEAICGNWLFLAENKMNPEEVFLVANFFEIRSNYARNHILQDGLVSELSAFTAEASKEIGAKAFLLRPLIYGSIPDFKYEKIDITIDKIGGYLDWGASAEAMYYLNALKLETLYIHPNTIEYKRQRECKSSVIPATNEINPLNTNDNQEKSLRKKIVQPIENKEENNLAGIAGKSSIHNNTSQNQRFFAPESEQAKKSISEQDIIYNR